MNLPRFIFRSLPAFVGVVTLTQAASVYWDINGTGTGATSDVGGVAGGVWSTSANNWSTNLNGGAATLVWAANDSAIFSAGTNATGASTVTLSGAQSATGITVDEGSITLAGDSLTTSGGSSIKSTLTLNNEFTGTTAGNVFDVSTGGFSGRLNIGTTGSLAATSGSLRVGVNATAATTTVGAVYQSGASAVSVNNLQMGTTSGTGISSTYYRIADTSTLSVANILVVGNSTGATSNFFDQAGGTVTVATASSGYVRVGGVTGSTAIMNVNGGLFTFNGLGSTNENSFVVAYGATSRGELNISGTVDVGTTLLRVAGNTGATGIVNLGTGGTLTAARVIDTGGSSTLNFNGGTVKATAATVSTNYFLTTDNIYVNAGGAGVDSNGFNITIAQALQAPAGDGVQAVAVTNGGTGYIGAPVVSITGGGGSGATGYAVMDSTGTQVVSVVITNPGGTFINAGGIATGGTGTFGAGNVTVAAGTSLTLGNASSIADTALLFFSQGANITLSSGTEALGNIVLGSTGIVASGLYSASDLNNYFGLTGGNEVFFGNGTYNIAASAIPEPSSVAALIGAFALTGALMVRRRRVS